MTRTLTKIISLAVTLVVALPAAQALAAPKSKLHFSQSAYAVAENVASGHADITIVRSLKPSATLNQTVNVHFSATSTSPNASAEFDAVDRTVTFGAGETSEVVQIPIHDDGVVGGPVIVNLRLSGAQVQGGGRALLTSPSSAVLAIAEADTPSDGGPAPEIIQLAAQPGAVDQVGEPSNGQALEKVFIVRSGDLSSSASVAWSTTDGTAVSGTDYTGSATPTSVTFPTQASDQVGSIIHEVDIPILHNPASSPATRDFTVSLSNPSSGASLGSPSSEDVSIVNVDGSPTLSFTAPSYSIAENGGAVRLTVIVSGSIANEVDADYATADGSAVAGIDYAAQADTLQFMTGDVAEYIDVPVIDDGVFGPGKQFSVGLSNPTGQTDAQLGSPNAAAVNVVEADPQPPIHDSGNGGNNSTGSNSAGSTATNGSSEGGQGGNQLVLGARNSACGLVVKAAKTQKLLKKGVLVLKVRTTKACKVSVGALIKQVAKKHRKAGHAARAIRFKGKNVSLSLHAGQTKTVKVRFSKKTVKAVAKALRARKRLAATVVVTARSGSAPAGKRTLKIAIRR